MGTYSTHEAIHVHQGTSDGCGFKPMFSRSWLNLEQVIMKESSKVFSNGCLWSTDVCVCVYMQDQERWDHDGETDFIHNLRMFSIPLGLSWQGTHLRQQWHKSQRKRSARSCNKTANPFSIWDRRSQTWLKRLILRIVTVQFRPS